ncbi:MAG: hypothetical protein JSW40_04945, partial [Candidatus Omnitrophota bacterium]
PGEEVSWGVKLNDARNRPVKGEVLALMYDRSLEYYITTHNLWLDNLYTLRTTPVSWTYSVLKKYGKNLPITEGLLEKLLKAFRQPPKEPNLPGLRTWRTWAKGDYGLWNKLRRGIGGVVEEEGAVRSSQLALDTAAPMMAKEAKAKVD